MKATMLNQIAETDSAFRREGTCWVGRCIICNGPLRFESTTGEGATGEGATGEHIILRLLSNGGDLLNLCIAHSRCNAETGSTGIPTTDIVSGASSMPRWRSAC